MMYLPKVTRADGCVDVIVVGLAKDLIGRKVLVGLSIIVLYSFYKDFFVKYLFLQLCFIDNAIK